MEYPVQDEVPKQNPVSDLQDQSISQPAPFLPPSCFSKENQFAYNIIQKKTLINSEYRI